MLTVNDIKKLLQLLATKDDLAKLATKDDLNNLENRVDEQFSKVDAQFAKVDTQFSKVDKQFSLLNKKIYGVLKYAENIEEERYDNEKRLKRIEKELSLPS